ncbi:hypothetical protein HanPI659440_Chr06g0242851 [Helianthus annuus]|nr:hypothetical protein HanPI659440_Chr06g0242851 [Helianthus annuus]
MFGFVLQISSLIVEKELKLRQAMAMMGLYDTAYWLSWLADQLLGSPGVPGSSSDRSFLPQSTTYNWSCSHFSKPLITATDGADEIAMKREERENLALNHIKKCQRACKFRNQANDLVDIINKNRTAKKKKLPQLNSPGLGCMALQYIKECRANCSENHTVNCKPPENDFTEILAQIVESSFPHLAQSRDSLSAVNKSI